MRMKKLVPCYLVSLLAGCMPVFSLNPLYTKETLTFEEKLLGTFIDPNKPGDTLEFARLEANAAQCLPADLRDQAAKCYQVNVTGGTGKGSLVGCLVKLQDRLFLDLMPSRLSGGEQNPESTEFVLNAMFFLPVHTFARVDLSGDQLKIKLTLDNKFKDLLQAEPKAVTYAMVQQSFIVAKRGANTVEEHPLLTASTSELQAFVTKYANDDRLFMDEMTFTRKSSSTAK